ncbi:MAG: helix-turn-helix domain-containing protein [Sphingomicrobium sp.]
MDEIEEDDVVSVGQQLRDAREALGLSIEEVAATTRIPTRHLASLEIGDWDQLPASTYSIGFAKNYATAVGLDKAEIAAQLRVEMGGARPVAPNNMEVYESADPARTMPKGLVFGALALVLVAVLLFTWLSNRSMESDPVAADNIAAPADSIAGLPEPVAAGTVVLTANEAVWIEVRDGGAILKQGELASGQSYEVPANAVAPQLTTGKPEALRIAVGTADAPAVGPAGERVTGVSLLAADLMKGPVAATLAIPRPTPRRDAPAPTVATPPATTTGNSAAATPSTE